MSFAALSELLSSTLSGATSGDGTSAAGKPLLPPTLPSLPLALLVFALFCALELLQRWSVLRPVRARRAQPCAAPPLT